jgi:hypothetical protein
VGNASTSRLLLAAADLIEAGEWSPDTPALAVSGAISRVAPDAISALEASRVLRRFLGRHRVGSWERGAGRTKAEVVAALRLAAMEAP